MDQIRIERLVLGMIETNCYLAQNETTGELVVIDPADEASRIRSMIDRLQAKPVAVLLTHGHFDHIGAAGELKDAFGIPVYAMRQEKELLASADLNLSGNYGEEITFSADEWLEDGQKLVLAGFEWEVLFTPGHTPGGCCYYNAAASALFSGDTLFRGSIGRTDFPRSSMRQLIDSLRTRLLTLPEDTAVYPGHGPVSTIGFEKRFNPFCAE